MAGTPLTRALYACTVTVPTSAASVLSLVQALGGIYANVSGSCRSWNLQADPSNAAGKILAGDENVAISPQQCGYNFASGAYTFLDRASCPGMAPIGSVYVVASTGSLLLNVLIFGD